MSTLVTWRDAALIVLSFEAFWMALAIGAALYFSLRGLRQFQASLSPYVLRVRLYTRQVREITVRMTMAVAAPFIWLRSVQAGVRKALNILSGR